MPFVFFGEPNWEQLKTYLTVLFQYSGFKVHTVAPLTSHNRHRLFLTSWSVFFFEFKPEYRFRKFVINAWHHILSITMQRIIVHDKPFLYFGIFCLILFNLNYYINSHVPIRSIMPMCSKKVTFRLSMSCSFLNDLFICSDTLVSLMNISKSFPETSTSCTNWQSRASHATSRPAFRDDLLKSYAELYFNFGVKIISEKTNAQSHIVCTGR